MAKEIVPRTQSEIFAANLCRKAGVTFQGLQRGYGITESLILFDDRHGSTCAIPLRSATTEGLCAKLLESEARWRGGKNAA